MAESRRSPIRAVSEVSQVRRLHSRAKLLEGWQRLADSNPQIDWTFDTAETLEAEKRVAEVKARYDRGEATLEDLRFEFGRWAAAQRDKRRQSSLFAGAK